MANGRLIGCNPSSAAFSQLIRCRFPLGHKRPRMARTGFVKLWDCSICSEKRRTLPSTPGSGGRLIKGRCINYHVQRRGSLGRALFEPCISLLLRALLKGPPMIIHSLWMALRLVSAYPYKPPSWCWLF